MNEDKYFELKEKIKQLSDLKSKYEKEINESRKELFDSAVEKWKPFVGKCFKTKRHGKDMLFVVEDIPQVQLTMMEAIYNRYSLPVFCISDNGNTKHTTITSYAIDSQNVYEEFCKENEPLTDAEFLGEVTHKILFNVIFEARGRYKNG
jgi:hypothetical protein